jgi:polysaccharide export outer membrane protein
VKKLVFAASSAAALLLGCASVPRKVDLPAAVETKTIGPDDAFEIRIVGEDKLPIGFTVAPDGTVDLPYISRLKVAGLEPQQLAALVRQRLIDAQILRDPSVSVSVKEYRSKKVEVLGEVAKPSSLALEPGMTLLRAISQAGGFNSIADKGHVSIRRRLHDGSTKAATVSVDDITSNRLPDIPLQAGDTIYVGQRVF